MTEQTIKFMNYCKMSLPRITLPATLPYGKFCWFESLTGFPVIVFGDTWLYQNTLYSRKTDPQLIDEIDIEDLQVVVACEVNRLLKYNIK